jgi:hypothetical protein
VLRQRRLARLEERSITPWSPESAAQCFGRSMGRRDERR